jgi:hypothetical protein
MKKTLLTIAFVFGTVAVMAQTNVVAKKELKTISSVNDIVKSVQKAKPVAKDLTYVWTCDFSNPTEITIGGAAGHQLANRFFVHGDATSFTTMLDHSQVFNPNNTNYNTPATFNSYFGFESIENGYVYVDPYYDRENILTYAWNTYIKFNNPIDATNLDVVELYLYQYYYKWNYDRCFIDWCTDGTFTAGNYDSVEFNAAGVEMESGSDILGQKRIILPVVGGIIKGGVLDPTAGIGTAGQPTLYIRIRFQSPAHQFGSGVFWLIDDVKVANGSLYGLQINSIDYYHGGGYHTMPQGLKPDVLDCYSFLENTGATDLKAVLENKFYVYNETTQTWSLEGSPSNISDTVDVYVARHEDTIWESGGTTINRIEIGHNHLANAFSTFLPTDNLGTYAVMTNVNITDGVAFDSVIEAHDTTMYYVKDALPYYSSINPQDSIEVYKWLKAQEILRQGSDAWKWGLNAGYSGNDPAAYLAGYQTCVSYTMSETYSGTPWYSNGISIAPAPDSCVAGARILGKLYVMDTAAADIAQLYVPVKTPSGNNVETFIYNVQASDLNNNVYANGTSTRQFNTIYLPFKFNVKLEPGTRYYACYELMSSTKFAVAKDFEFSNATTFGPQGYTNPFSDFVSYWYGHVLVYTPNGSNPMDAGVAVFTKYAENQTPLIGLMVAKANSLNGVETSVGSLNMYPNPAQNQTTLAYTLKNAGDVTIVVTDLMGREVVKMNEGKKAAGVSYESNINTSNLANGTYFYTISVNGVKQTNKFVVNR